MTEPASVSQTLSWQTGQTDLGSEWFEGLVESSCLERSFWKGVLSPEATLELVSP